jgi:Flp pilus assembly protein TadB
MDFSLHEQRTLARIEQELSDDRRLAALMKILDPKKPKRFRRLRSFAYRLRHPRQDIPPMPGHLRVLDTRPLLALTIVLTVACTAVLVTALVLGIGTLVVFASVVLPLPPLLALVAYLRLRPRRRRK